MNTVLRALMNRCPACGDAPLFQGVYRLYETCPACGARHERFPGTWTLASWIAASLGVISGGVAAVLLYRSGGFPWSTELLILSLGAAVALLTYRPLKAVLFGLFHAMGLAEPDPVVVGKVIFLDRYKRRHPGAPERRRVG